MQELSICGCCGASTWTKVIAWLHLIWDPICLIVLVAAAPFALRAELNGLDYPMPEEDYFGGGYPDVILYIPSGTMLAVVCLFIVIFALDFSMAQLLLRASTKKNIGYLRWWSIYMKICFGLGVTSGLLGIVVPLFLIITVLISVMMAFQIWVVGVHITEIEVGGESVPVIVVVDDTEKAPKVAD